MKFLISLGVLVSIMMSSPVFSKEAELKHVLVTGASSGLGLRIAEVLSDNGYLVYAGARNEEDLKRLEAIRIERVGLDVAEQGLDSRLVVRRPRRAEKLFDIQKAEVTPRKVTLHLGAAVSHGRWS